MSYEDLIKVEDIFDTKSKLKAHAEYYQKKILMDYIMFIMIEIQIL